MPAIETVTAPLLIRWKNGTKKVVAAAFTHPAGVLYLDLYWHQSSPDQAAHLIDGTISGDGPWKIADAVIEVLGCHGCEPELATIQQQWQDYLMSAGLTTGHKLD